MAQPPGDEEPAERALEHVIAHLFDSELTRLAYARPSTPDDERRAEAALRELARRAAAAPAPDPAPVVAERPAPVRFRRLRRLGRLRRRPQPTPGIPTRPAAPPEARTRREDARRDSRRRAHRDAPRRARRDAHRDAPRPGRRRAGALAAVGTLLLSTVAALSAAATPAPEAAPPSALQQLYREATPVERELRDRMLAAGLPVTIGPRHLAEQSGGERLLAYRSVRAGTAETARNDVCVLLVDAETLRTPVCITREAFLDEGLRTTLEGSEGRWSVRWGPTDEAEVQVRRSGSSASIPPYAPALR
ncbi:hypothetical protein OVN18_00155 [Microcella daejeonensis]|uniref:Uncharacterized protein n=1 Tax=Microcella daejeonensis TaxID=2994971 RepID=A0A9E8MKW9_9MICO|nr:hypothetical protein [Microcella daejeonensis]WAB81480.1 hypothetical protein OVN18_00155 [Microcella daejeonensis]